ncbi:MAG: amidohydrolase [Planctomycetes bacterium]|nr:amidohydrolase [Planctomycetota bacterium]
MPEFSRRSFIGGALLGASAWPALADAPKQPAFGGAPDQVLLGATIYTVDDQKPKAEAFAIKNGRFSAVGSSDEIRKLVGPATQVIEANGLTVVPGFIDAHCHPASAGLAELIDVNCDRPAIADIKKAIQERAGKTAPDKWIFGFKYDDTKLKDGRPLNRTDLDEAAPKHPVRVTHRGGHTCIYNSLALKLAGIDKKTSDPEGGKFGRDEKGELTGFAAETANEAFAKLTRRADATPSQRQAGIKLISELMTAAGLTSVHDAMVDRNSFVAYQDALAAGEMRFRLYAMVLQDLWRALAAAGIRSGFGDDRLRIGGVKLFCDGSASERTMRMSKAYIGRPNDFGILVISQDKLNDLVTEIHASGFQVGIHANGDVAIDMVLKAYELVHRLHPRKDTRHRIEHCTLVNPDLLRRMADQGVIPTPFYTYVYYHGDKWAQYGDERVRWMFAHRSFLDHGIRVAGASDYVPGPFEPLMAIQSMTTRKDYRGRVWGENQKITVDEALRICTINGAHASFEEKIKGSITEGKLADFVALAEDPHKVDPLKIKDIKIERTVVGGKTVYSNGK